MKKKPRLPCSNYHYHSDNLRLKVITYICIYYLVKTNVGIVNTIYLDIIITKNKQKQKPNQTIPYKKKLFLYVKDIIDVNGRISQDYLIEQLKKKNIF